MAVLGFENWGKLATETQLRKAFRLRARSCHPDKVAAHLEAWATTEMQRINEAHRVLLANVSGKLIVSRRDDYLALHGMHVLH